MLQKFNRETARVLEAVAYFRAELGLDVFWQKTKNIGPSFDAYRGVCVSEPRETSPSPIVGAFAIGNRIGAIFYRNAETYRDGRRRGSMSSPRRMLSFNLIISPGLVKIPNHLSRVGEILFGGLPSSWSYHNRDGPMVEDRRLSHPLGRRS